MNPYRHLWRSAPFVAIVFLTTGVQARAQDADSTVVALPAVEIAAARATESQSSAPFAVSVQARPLEVAALEPALSLDEALRDVLGLNVSDRGHLALGERVSVRGMGTRAAFGVRGVQVVLDGIPLTLPDGQAVVEVVDPVFVRSAELIRGPSSHFWGNTSGGVLFITTRAPTQTHFARIRVLGGSYGQRQVSAETAFRLNNHHIHFHASDTRQDGYRDYSSGRISRAGAHGSLRLGRRTQLMLTAALADLDTEHPGALTQEQIQENERLADPRFVNTRSGKESLQVQGSASLLVQSSVGLLAGTVFGIVRDLDNPLPFAYIGVDRTVGGVRLTLTNQLQRVNWGLGVDMGRQADDRRNWNNNLGVPGEELRLDQRETVRTVAGFGYASTRVAGPVHANVGLRLDAVDFASKDRLLDNGDDSGSRTLSAVSPAFGLAIHAEAAVVFANVSTAFETPTTTELVNRPDLTGGFNPDLVPQRVQGFEVGARGESAALRSEFDVALFRMKVKDRLAPFQTADGGARTFFRNDGSSVHQGVEAALTWRPRDGLHALVQYTYGRFVFTDDRLDGNRLPGSPGNRLLIRVRGEHRGLWGRVTVDRRSGYYVDDENAARDEGSTVVDVNIGHIGLSAGGLAFQPFVAIQNLTGVKYNGSVVVNANGMRYYEPAPARAIQAGMGMQF